MDCNSHRSLPKTVQEALRHFNTVESDITSLTSVLCVDSFDATVANLRRAYKRLAMLVHPDRCKGNERNATRAMRTVVRAKTMVDNFVEYNLLMNNIVDEKEFLLSSSIKFNVFETKEEIWLSSNEAEIIRRERDDSTVLEGKGNSQPPTHQCELKQCLNSGDEDIELLQARIALELAEKRRKQQMKSDSERFKSTRKINDDTNGTYSSDNYGDGGLGIHDVDKDGGASIADGSGDDVLEKEGDVNSDGLGNVKGDVIEGYMEESDDLPDPTDQSGDGDQDHEHGTSNAEDVLGNYRPSPYMFEDNVEICDLPESRFGLNVMKGECQKYQNSQLETQKASDESLHEQGRAQNSTQRKVSASTNRQMLPSERLRRLKVQKRSSKKKVMNRAKLALKAEQVDSMTWTPKRCVEIKLELNIQLSFRWQCEQLIRAHTAYVGVHCGVNIRQSWQKVEMKCRNKECRAHILFNWQPRSGLWKLNKIRDHINECFNGGYGNDNKPKFCAPAYTPLQVTRIILNDASNNPNISAKQISALVKAKEIYRRQPPDSHFRSVRQEILRHMNESREVDMASLEGYAELLRSCGHTVQIFLIDGNEMKEKRLKAARHVFYQCRKDNSLPADAIFNSGVVDMTDIKDTGRYYGGMLFVASVADRYSKMGRKTASADATHCEGVGIQSYGTVFEVVTYDANMNSLPLVFAHFIGTENFDYWKIVFEAAKSLSGFDVPTRTTIVDHEKSIDRAYKEVFQHAKLFLDPLTLRKNMEGKLGSLEAIGLSLYDRALYAPTKSMVDELIAQYSPIQRDYLTSFPKSEIYCAYSLLEDGIVTSQGAESSMGAEVRNHIRCVEPQKMLSKVILTQRAGFLRRQEESENWEKPVPPSIEQRIESLILRSIVYQDTVRQVRNSENVFTVRSVRDGSQRRTVVLPTTDHVVPSCCGYSTTLDGYPCLHGVSVLCDRIGASKLFRYISKRHLTSQWTALYANMLFSLPSQADIDDVVTNAKVSILKGTNLDIPKALPPPRGRRFKNPGVRKKGLIENGPAHKKNRSYACSLCRSSGHDASACHLKQLFGNGSRSYISPTSWSS